MTNELLLMPESYPESAAAAIVVRSFYLSFYLWMLRFCQPRSKDSLKISLRRMLKKAFPDWRGVGNPRLQPWASPRITRPESAWALAPGLLPAPPPAFFITIPALSATQLNRDSIPRQHPRVRPRQKRITENTEELRGHTEAHKENRSLCSLFCSVHSVIRFLRAAGGPFISNLIAMVGLSLPLRCAAPPAPSTTPSAEGPTSC